MTDDDAVRIANEVPELSVKPNGEVVVTGECGKITAGLCAGYEKALRGSVLPDIEVRLNVLSNRREEA